MIIRETNGSRTLSFESHFNAFCKPNNSSPPPRPMKLSRNYESSTIAIISLVCNYGI